ISVLASVGACPKGNTKPAAARSVDFLPRALGGWGGQFGADQGFDAIQNVWIAFDFDVWPFEGAREPRIAFATDGICCVVEPDVFDNLRVRGIGGTNLRAPVDDVSIGLIEISGLGYVRGD